MAAFLGNSAKVPGPPIDLHDALRLHKESLAFVARPPSLAARGHLPSVSEEDRRWTLRADLLVHLSDVPGKLKEVQECERACLAAALSIECTRPLHPDCIRVLDQLDKLVASKLEEVINHRKSEKDGHGRAAANKGGNVQFYDSGGGRLAHGRVPRPLALVDQKAEDEHVRSYEEDPRFRHLPYLTWVLDLRTYATKEFPFVQLLLGDSAATSPTDADLEHGFTASTVDQTTTVCYTSTGKTLVARTQSRDWENWVLRLSTKDLNALVTAIGLSPGDTAKLKEMATSAKKNDSRRVWRARKRRAKSDISAGVSACTCARVAWNQA